MRVGGERNSYAQRRWFRAPEVMLGLPYGANAQEQMELLALPTQLAAMPPDQQQLEDFLPLSTDELQQLVGEMEDSPMPGMPMPDISIAI